MHTGQLAGSIDQLELISIVTSTNCRVLEKDNQFLFQNLSNMAGKLTKI